MATIAGRGTGFRATAAMAVGVATTALENVRGGRQLPPRLSITNPRRLYETVAPDEGADGQWQRLPAGGRGSGQRLPWV